MKFFFQLSILFVTSCSGLYAQEKQSKIDTAKLFDPKPESNDDFGSPDMFKHAVIIQPDLFGIVINGKEYKLSSTENVKDFIYNNSAEISKRRFFIVCDSSTSFSKIVSIIANLQAAKIDNYRVINIQSYFKPTEPMKFEEPTITTKTVDVNDSSYFKIDIKATQYVVSLLNQATTFKDTLDLDRFFKKNKRTISTKKIVLISHGDEPYKRVKPIIEILKKHQYFKFEMIAR